MTATKSYYLIRILSSFSFSLMAIASSVYRLQVVGLSPFELVLVGTVLELSYFLAEIPTGVVADVYSRKLSVIIGYILIGLGFIVEGLFPSLTAVLLAQVIWGVGATFLSGAESAWLADEVGESRLGPILLRGHQLASLMGIIGILLAIPLGSYDLGFCFVLAGLLSILLGLSLIKFMPETAFKRIPQEERSSFQKLFNTFQGGLNFVRVSSLLPLLFSSKSSLD
ncbi:MAG: MFS transporter [Deinococcales bacterium]